MTPQLEGSQGRARGSPLRQHNTTTTKEVQGTVAGALKACCDRALRRARSCTQQREDGYPPTRDYST